MLRKISAIEIFDEKNFFEKLKKKFKNIKKVCESIKKLRHAWIIMSPLSRTKKRIHPFLWASKVLHTCITVGLVGGGVHSANTSAAKRFWKFLEPVLLLQLCVCSLCVAGIRELVSVSFQEKRDWWLRKKLQMNMVEVKCEVWFCC